MTKQFTIQGTLVKDHIQGYSYNLLSKIDAETLYQRLQTQQEQINTLETLQQQSHEIEQKLDKITKTIIQIQMTTSILSEELQHLQEVLK
jgi:Tfp pilus assembly protein PilO